MSSITSLPKTVACSVVENANIIVGTPSGLDKLSKLIINISKLFQKRFPKVTNLSRQMSSMRSGIQAFYFVGGIKYFSNVKTDGSLFNKKTAEGTKQGLINIAQRAFFLVADCLASVCWLNAAEVIALGAVSFTLGAIGLKCVIAGLAIGSILAVRDLVKTCTNNENRTHLTRKIIDHSINIFKNCFDCIGLVIAGYVSMPYVAILGIISGGIGITSILSKSKLDAAITTA